MVDHETDRVVEDFPDYDPAQVLEEAFNRVMEWRGGERPQASLDTKLNEKRTIRQPRGSSLRSQPAPAKKRETRSEYVQKQRKMRGLE